MWFACLTKNEQDGMFKTRSSASGGPGLESPSRTAEHDILSCTKVSYNHLDSKLLSFFKTKMCLCYR